MIDLKDAVAECRTQILMDVDASDFRWPDPIMVRAANLTISDILRKRPILLFSDINEYGNEEDFMIPDGALKNGGTYGINIPAKYREAFLHGLAARCYNGDANNQMDASRMAIEKQRFDELMSLQ